MKEMISSSQGFFQSRNPAACFPTSLTNVYCSEVELHLTEEECWKANSVPKVGRKGSKTKVLPSIRAETIKPIWLYGPIDG